ncbi:MAG TPA: chloride channel protein [Syntrophobacteraceae bacterium]|nr:chloride channel protein [Syntrophobacteraceae bacterium]
MKAISLGLRGRIAELKQFGWSGRFRGTFLSIVVGVIAGLGAILFEELLRQALHYFLFLSTGFKEPLQGSEAAAVSALASVRSWLFLVIPTLGGLAAGLLVFFTAPEAEGHGTDAMIDAFHRRGGHIRKRVPLVKILASAITIGSGGSAGKEGPIAQIGAGFGSVLATILRLRPRDRRILVLAGASGGIGAIFHAPLGAALFAPEVLYRGTDFESDAILPCIISSIVASSIFDQYFGRQALFFPGPVDFSVIELPAYALFGMVCAGVGYVYIKVFYGSRDRVFRPVRIPKMLKPALGGFLLGLTALLCPPIMDGGYGWIQAAMEGKIFWGTMLLLVFMKIAATSCTISSGGSGGVFGPSVFMGAMLGGAFGFLGHGLAPQYVVHPSSFVVVGIGGFFAGVAKVPVSSIIMACEMCGNYALLVPLMLVSALSTLALGKTGLYEKQTGSRLTSPAHMGEFAEQILEQLEVRQAVTLRPVTQIRESTPFHELLKIVTASQELHFPVVNGDGKMTGILSLNDIRQVMLEEGIGDLIVAKDVATPNVVCVFLDESLKSALQKMIQIDVDELPVVCRQAPDSIITMISKRDIISHYYERSRSLL